MRNTDAKYSTDSDICVFGHETPLELECYFANVAQNRTINFSYNLNLLFENPEYLRFFNDAPKLILGEKVETYKNLYKFCDNVFNQFVYITYRNVDVHYMNMSVYHSSVTQLKNNFHTITNNTELKERLLSQRPRLSSIYFLVNKKLHSGFICQRIPYLPLIVGMKYIFRGSEFCVSQGLYRNKEFYLLYMGSEYLLLIDKNNDLLVCGPGKFTMCMLCDSPKNYHYMQDDDDDKEETPNEKTPTDRCLWGFPFQLASGTTVRCCIGLDIKKDIFVNLSGCGREECYGALSRCTDKSSIKGVAF